jgi:colanic acid biosynthesis glycosyl transferase WcaI
LEEVALVMAQSTILLSENPVKAADGRRTQKRLRVLVVHRYFWPDVAPVAAILRAIGDRFADQGHDVTVFTSQPCYKPELKKEPQPWREDLGRLHVRRCRLIPESSRNPIVRLLNFAMFLFRAMWHVFFRARKYDMVISLSFPPIVSGALIGRAAKWRGSRYLYHIMDLHPESARFAGKLSNGFVYRFAQWLDGLTCRFADDVVVLSADMERTLRSRPRLSDLENVSVIANFNIPDYNSTKTPAVPSELVKAAGKYRLIFAGNLGHFQALDNVVAAAKLLANRSDIEFVFLGEGAAKKSLIQQAGDALDRTIRFFPHQPVAVCDQLMAGADLGIVSLTQGIIQVANPCKTSSYLSLGLPTLVIVEEDSELFRVTEAAGIGYSCPPNNPERLRDTVLRAFSERESATAKRSKAKRFADENLTQEVLLEKWEGLISKIAGQWEAS